LRRAKDGAPRPARHGTVPTHRFPPRRDSLSARARLEFPQTWRRQDQLIRNAKSVNLWARHLRRHKIWSWEVELMLSRRCLIVHLSTTALVGALAVGSNPAAGADKTVKIGINLPFTG